MVVKWKMRAKTYPSGQHIYMLKEEAVQLDVKYGEKVIIDQVPDKLGKSGINSYLINWQIVFEIRDTATFGREGNQIRKHECLDNIINEKQKIEKFIVAMLDFI